MVLDWPQRNGSKPVTTALNQAIFKAAALALSHELPEETTAFCNAIDHCKTRWRQDYIPLMEQFVRLQAKASSPAIVQSCLAGLNFATNSFVVRNNNEPDSTISIEQAFVDVANQSPLPTETFSGTISESLTSNQFKLASPHGTDSDPIWLSGDEAIAQINTWKDYGCMEPSAADHATSVCSSNNMSDFVSGKTFCLMGITSEMGPTLHLLKIPGAHVMGVARYGPKLDALKEWFQINGPINTTLQLTAADLLNDMVAIAQWIVATAPSHQPLVLMPLAYMDGEANVRVTVAMDAIITYVLRHRETASVSLVYLTSPTTIYTIPKEAAMDAQRRYTNYRSSWTNQIISTGSFGNWLRPSNTWKQLEINQRNTEAPTVLYNGAFHLQGPNYCLAKLMQQWRCIVANADGSVVSLVHAPHAPGTRTLSVRHNSQAAVAIEGLQYFPPMLTFDVLTCSSLLTAIILNQLQQKKRILNHPMELFWDGSVHGGGWRCPYSSESILALTYILGKTWAKPGWCPSGALASKPSS
jgi:hypothetical protein